ncbi:hypothetical protein CMI44_00060, partial [Candidatus Pacearchaeota archaeon]|nr:hypothetical protein [Candidatus Pacearchaeota archaeon]
KFDVNGSMNVSGAINMTKLSLGNVPITSWASINGTELGNVTINQPAITGPVVNTTQGNMTITSRGGSVIIQLG